MLSIWVDVRIWNDPLNKLNGVLVTFMLIICDELIEANGFTGAGGYDDKCWMGIYFL